MQKQISPAEYTEFVMGLFNRAPNDLSKDFAHAALGILTEIGELRSATDDTNSLEEVGDLLFYYTAAQCVLLEAQQLPIPTDGWLAFHNFPGNLESAEEDLFHLLDMAKRWIGYGRAPDFAQASEILAAVAKLPLETELAVILPQESFDTAIQLAADANVAKLRVRYKTGKFSPEQALNRNLDAEYAALSTAAPQ